MIQNEPQSDTQRVLVDCPDGLPGCLVAHFASVPLPEPKDLFCPACGLRHIDEGEWVTRLHKTHRCVGFTGPIGDVVTGCGHEWRPFDHATVGRPTRGD